MTVNHVVTGSNPVQSETPSSSVGRAVDCKSICRVFDSLLGDYICFIFYLIKI